MADFLGLYGPALGVVGFYLRLSGLPIPIAEHALPVYLGHQFASSTPGLVVSWLGLVALSVAGTTNLYLLGRWWGPSRAGAFLSRVLRLERSRRRSVQGWYERWGWAAVMVGSQVPGVRVPVLVGAGALGVRYRVFAACIAAAMAPRLAIGLWVGVAFGDALADYLNVHPAVFVVIGALLALVLIGIARRVLMAGSERAAEPSEEAAESPDRAG